MKSVMDSEMALWSAVRSIFPTPKVQCCAFHWKQVVWRKVQSLGLAVPLRQPSSHTGLHSSSSLMGLPFLPEKHISGTFCHLESHVPVGPCLDLITYMHNTWISGLWSPGDRTAFGQSVRTNNDVDSHDTQLNDSAGSSHIPMYRVCAQPTAP